MMWSGWPRGWDGTGEIMDATQRTFAQASLAQKGCLALLAKHLRATSRGRKSRPAAARCWVRDGNSPWTAGGKLDEHRDVARISRAIWQDQGGGVGTGAGRVGRVLRSPRPSGALSGVRGLPGVQDVAVDRAEDGKAGSRGKLRSSYR